MTSKPVFAQTKKVDQETSLTVQETIKSKVATGTVNSVRNNPFFLADKKSKGTSEVERSIIKQFPAEERPLLKKIISKQFEKEKEAKLSWSERRSLPSNWNEPAQTDSNSSPRTVKAKASRGSLTELFPDVSISPLAKLRDIEGIDSAKDLTEKSTNEEPDSASQILDEAVLATIDVSESIPEKEEKAFQKLDLNFEVHATHHSFGGSQVQGVSEWNFPDLLSEKTEDWFATKQESALVQDKVDIVTESPQIINESASEIPEEKDREEVVLEQKDHQETLPALNCDADNELSITSDTLEAHYSEENTANSDAVLYDISHIAYSEDESVLDRSAMPGRKLVKFPVSHLIEFKSLFI